MAPCIVNYWGLEVRRTDFIAPYCIVPNRNLQGLPKHLNGFPKVSEQNPLPQNMVWCTRVEASRAPGDPTLEGPWIRPHQDFLARTRPHQTPHHRGEGGGFPPTRPHTTGEERGSGKPPPFCGVGCGGVDWESPSLLPSLWCGVWWVGIPLPSSFLVWGLEGGNPPPSFSPCVWGLVGRNPPHIYIYIYIHIYCVYYS